MNIKILDSWIREYLETEATVAELRKALSLCSVSVERIEKVRDDIIYDIEVTTNRPDLMSVIGIAREAAVVLPQFGIPAKFKQLKTKNIPSNRLKSDILIENNPKLVNRILAVVMDVNIGESPEYIKNRLEATDIRSLNNIIDVTNYVMREIGHPTHVFDYDRLFPTGETSRKLIIRESKPREKLKTLDGVTHELPGGDIVAVNSKGEIVDLLGIMGTENSVVTDQTKRILFFLDNNNPLFIRKTSMKLGIRTEAAILNEKGVDPELMEDAFLRGIELFKNIASGKIISEIIDIYPNKPQECKFTVNTDHIRSVIGVDIKDTQIKSYLKDLGFEPVLGNSTVLVKVPTWRLGDVSIEEDIIEEVARIYGYHNLPSVLPPVSSDQIYRLDDDSFYWEKRVKQALKYWGFTETYTYSMVSKDLLETPIDQALKLKNPLDEDHLYMRQTLIPSMLQVVHDHPQVDNINLFEIANVYTPRKNDLPDEKLHLGIVVKKDNVSFFELKGLVEQIANDLGIEVTFSQSDRGDGANILVSKQKIGNIEMLENEIANIEIDFTKLLVHATTTKTYTPIIKHPPIIEDLRVQLPPVVTYEKVVSTIKKQSNLVKEVSLLDIYEDKKTFRIVYQHKNRNLTNEDVSDIRNKIIISIEKELKGKVV